MDWLQLTAPSDSDGNESLPKRKFSTRSGTIDTGKLTEARRYFASGKSLSEQRPTPTSLECNREAHSAGSQVRLAADHLKMSRTMEAGAMGQLTCSSG